MLHADSVCLIAVGHATGTLWAVIGTHFANSCTGVAVPTGETHVGGGTLIGETTSITLNTRTGCMAIRVTDAAHINLYITM